MFLPYLADFCAGMAIAGSYAPKVVSWFAVQSIYSFGVVSRRNQQFIKWLPVISPMTVEVDPSSQLLFAYFPAPPSIQNFLIARQDGFQSQHNAPGPGTFLEQLRGESLRRRKRVIVTDQQELRIRDP